MLVWILFEGFLLNFPQTQGLCNDSSGISELFLEDFGVVPSFAVGFRSSSSMILRSGAVRSRAALSLSPPGGRRRHPPGLWRLGGRDGLPEGAPQLGGPPGSSFIRWPWNIPM